MILQSIIALLAGVGVFIAGMNMMGDGLEKSAGKGMKKLLGTISKNRFAGVGVGTAVTAIIQSSSATTVMVIGFVNAGIMTLFQATSIIMGANIGTTVTGIIVSLKSLNVSLYATLLAFVGVMMTFFKEDKLKNIGNILCGLGIIFIGLDLMSAACAGEEIKVFFKNIFKVIEFPLLLVLIGAIFTGILQSSSAATGVVIIMVGEGALSVENALFIVLGSNIGTCITAAIASIGTSTNAKRTALIHLTFNILGTILFTAILWPLSSKVTALLATIAPTPQMQIAWFHVIFNITTTVILLPFVKQLVKFAETVIPEKKPEEELRKLKFVDDRLLKTPPIALMQTQREIHYMANLAKENIEKALLALFEDKGTLSDEIRENEKIINFTNKALTRFLIKLTPLVNNEEEQTLGSYFHVLNDLERIGDHAENFLEIGEQMRGSELAFSDVAREEISKMYDEIIHMFEVAVNAFDHLDASCLTELTTREDTVDAFKKELNAKHVQRLALGNCSTDTSAYFFSTVSGLERVADHLVNVGFSILNPTGSQKA